MHFTLQPDDMARMQRFAMQRVLSSTPRKPLLLGLRVLSWLAIAFLFFSLMKAYDCCESTQPYLTNAGYAAFAGAILFAASAYILRSGIAASTVTQGGWFLSQQSVSVSQSGLLHGSRLGEFNVPWSTFLWRAEDDRNFYLFVDQGIGFVYPKSAIPDESHQALVRAKVAE
jgi:YcxB-like protein